MTKLLPQTTKFKNSAWWMNDNHTFVNINLNDDWKAQVLACREKDKGGSLFIRDKVDEKLLLTLHGNTDTDYFTEQLDLFIPA